MRAHGRVKQHLFGGPGRGDEGIGIQSPPANDIGALDPRGLASPRARRDTALVGVERSLVDEALRHPPDAVGLGRGDVEREAPRLGPGEGEVLVEVGPHAVRLIVVGAPELPGEGHFGAARYRCRDPAHPVATQDAVGDGCHGLTALDGPAVAVVRLLHPPAAFEDPPHRDVVLAGLTLEADDAGVLGKDVLGDHPKRGGTVPAPPGRIGEAQIDHRGGVVEIVETEHADATVRLVVDPEGLDVVAVPRTRADGSVTCSAVGRVRTWNGNVFEMRNAVSAARSSGSDRAARVREIPTRPP